MTSKDFSPELATTGRPIQFCKTGGVWVDVHYLGPDRVRGGYFVQFFDGSVVSTQALRMKPLPTLKWVLEFRDRNSAHAAHRVLMTSDVKWSVPDVLEVEVPPSDF
jgi:hypothetical protein